MIIDRASGKIVGSTRYCSIDHDNKGIEIGFTFIRPEFQRGYVNSHAKYLLLRHAFESFGAIRVQFRTHEHNQKSRNAITRLGATFEGVIQHQRIQSDGSVRNTAQFSITNRQWPTIKIKLLLPQQDHVESLQLAPSMQQLVSQSPLAQISIASGENLLAQTIYIPLWYDAARHVFVGHLAKRNKLCWLLENSPKVNLVFHGQDAYISPTWHQQQIVPTWNYQRLHASGAFKFLADEDKANKLDLLAQQLEYITDEQWKMSDGGVQQLNKMSEHIRCFEIAILDWQAIEKLSDKKPQLARDAIARQLEGQGLDQLAQCHYAQK